MRLQRKDILGLQEMNADEIQLVLDTADSFHEILERPIRKVPTLRGKSIVTLFYEPSTRTRTSFETAAKILSADTTSISPSTSSVVKGETLKDTMLTLQSIGGDVFIIRHQMAGAPHMAAKYVPASIINAGDGMHEHPTQGLLDLLTIRQFMGRIDGLKVAIIGDILHSRVARSDIWGLNKLGAEVRVCGPATMMPAEIDKMGVKVCYDLKEALEGVNIVYLLRIQLERQKAGLFPSVKEYHQLFGMTLERMEWAAPDAVAMHPGPINRGIEIAPDLADSNRAVLLDQVTNGLAIRMALLYLLIGGTEEGQSEVKQER